MLYRGDEVLVEEPEMKGMVLPLARTSLLSPSVGYLDRKEE